MANIPLLEERNAARWAAMHVRANRLPEMQAVARKLLANKARYQKIEAHLVSIGRGVPWWFVAIVDEREGGGHCNRQLGQGDPLGAVSTHDPKGRGPFFGADAFERSCYDALIDCAPHAALWKDWTPGGVATIAEEYNGLGYAGKGVPSAYVWSGSDQYSHGKYVADHDYRDDVVDVQEGFMPLLACMRAIDPSIQFASAAGPWKGSVSAQPDKPTRPVRPQPASRGWLAALIEFFTKKRW